MKAPAAQKRRHARLAAVQALYQSDISGENPIVVMGEFRRHRLGREIEGIRLDVDDAFFVDLIEGSSHRRAEIDAMIEQALSTGRGMARLEVVLRAILRLGAYELLARGDVPARSAIKEYVDIAGDFFDVQETSLVNGVLDRLARIVRAEEMGTATPAPADGSG